MSRSVKPKNASQSPKTNKLSSSPSMTIYERDYIMSNLLNVLFEQVKLQQEVRDRWFGHYLTIIGALAALATLCLKIFENIAQKEMLYLFLGMLFVFACLLGSLFYILYLCQRKNYKQTYNVLSALQTEIFKSMSVIPPQLYKESVFSTKRHGADFYTLLIQSLIDATMLAVGIAFLSISQMVKIGTACKFAGIGFVGIFVVLHLVRYFYDLKGENKKDEAG